ncbi:MAG: PKD domain-containing protein, partial [Candidatus Saccharimonadales bacterium]
MNRLARIIKIPSKKLILTVGLVLGLTLVGLGGLSTNRALAADCDNNAIIYCGTSSASSFIAKVRANSSGNGHNDLQAIYAHYGLEPSDYDNFVQYSRPGTAYKDGRIVVDGQVVSTNSTSLGRLASYQGSGYFSSNIGGTIYYGNNNSTVFKNSSIPVMVLFNGQGVMQFAVLTSCGNPTVGNRTVPTYGCTLLNHSESASTANRYTFNTSAYASNNASISKIVYDFGDGSSTTNIVPAYNVAHTYTKSGTFKVTAKIYVHLPGNKDIVVQSAGCSYVVKINIAPPPTPPTPSAPPTPQSPPSAPRPAQPSYQCNLLTATATDSTNYAYKFVVSGSASNGASITSADFNFGDNSNQSGVKFSNGSATTNHSYAAGGNKTVSATLNIVLPDGSRKTATSGGCSTLVVVPSPECAQLAGSALDQAKMSFRFVATGHYSSGIVLKSGDFTFGDGHSSNGVP